MRGTVLRPTGFFNDMAEVFEMARKGTAWIVGDGDIRFNPIHGADLADVVARAVSDPEMSDDLERGGPEVFTMREMVELAFEVLGRPPRIRSVPPIFLSLLRYLTRPFNPNLSTFLAFFVR